MTIPHLLALLAGAGAPAAAVSGPQGDFTVVAARLDRAIGNAQALYQEDDPQLVGRIVSFGPARGAFDDMTCSSLRATAERTTARVFFRQVFPKRASPNYAPYPAPADFRLPISPTAPLRGVRFRCASGSRDGSAADQWTQAAAFALPQGRWGLEWGGDFVLVLAPRPRGTPIRAGFDCAKAATPVERTICMDAGLAGWDRSVAVAYRAALSASGGDPTLVQSQKQWLAERLKCGTNKSCLHEVMSLRTANLAKAG